jgi:hypothetical protein
VKPSSTKNFWRPPKPCSAGRVCRFEFTDEFKAWLSTSTPSGSVRSWSHIFLRHERAHRPFWVATIKRFGAPRTNGGGTRRESDASRKFRWKSRPDDWDVRASSESARLCLPRKGDSSAFSNRLPFFEEKNGISIQYLNSRTLVTASKFWNPKTILKFLWTLFLAGISFLKKHLGIFFWPLLQPTVHRLILEFVDVGRSRALDNSFLRCGGGSSRHYLWKWLSREYLRTTRPGPRTTMDSTHVWNSLCP